MGDEELRAILEGDVLVVVVQRHELFRARRDGLRRSGLCRINDGDLSSRERGVHALHDGDEPSSARIHHARFCEHREHLRRLFENGFARGDDLGEKLLELSAAFSGYGCRRFRHDADDGKYRAFLGFRDCAVSDLGAAFECRGKGLFVYRNLRVQRDRETLEYLRQYDAAVAARAFERAFGERDREFAYIFRTDRRDLAHGGRHGEGHIRARVAVRHGEYVELVDNGTVQLESFRTAGEHILESASIYDIHYYLPIRP